MNEDTMNNLNLTTAIMHYLDVDKLLFTSITIGVFEIIITPFCEVGVGWKMFIAF